MSQPDDRAKRSSPRTARTRRNTTQRLIHHAMIAKLALTIIGLIALALGLTVLLDAVKFERALSEQVESRFAFVVEELKATAETGFDFGFRLANMKNMEPAIERELQRDDRILSITLFDQEKILVHAGKDRFAANPPEAGALWRRTQATPAGRWRDETSAAWQVGIGLTDTSGRPAGGIVLQYDRASYDRDIRQTRAGLARVAAILGLSVTPLVFVALFGLFRRLRTSLARVRSALDRSISDPRAAAFRPRADAPLERRYAAAEQTIREALAMLDSPRAGLKPTGAAKG